MKIETVNDEVILKEVFSGVTIETTEGKKLYICLRDWGYDMKIDNGKWHHINSEIDFKNEN